jgi:SAM-dependent methyltransferase
MPLQPADFYDLIYGYRDYAGEAMRLHGLIRRYKRAPGVALLDVGCGAGAGLAFLQQHHYAVEGLDRDPAMLAAARARRPGIPFHEADMADFRLDHPVDVIICLFSAIAYTGTVARLRQTLANFRRHLRPGGVAIVEPWVEPDRAAEGSFTPLLVTAEGRNVARLTENHVRAGHSLLTMHYLAQDGSGVQYLREEHDLALFTAAEYAGAFAAAGFTVAQEPGGFRDRERGLYVGVAPPA